MTEKRYDLTTNEENFLIITDNDDELSQIQVVNRLNELVDENEQLKKELKRCKEWLNSDKYDYETTLAFIKSKGFSLKDVIEYKGDVE